MKRIFLTIAAACLIIAAASLAQFPEKGGGSGGGGATYTFNSPLSETAGTVTCPTCSVTTPGLVLIQRQAASSSATLDFASCISSTYDNYEFWFNKLKVSNNGVDIGMRYSTDGGSSYDTGNNYNWIAQIFIAGATALVNDGGTLDGYSTIANVAANTADWSYNGKLQLYGPLDTSSYLFATQQSVFRNTANNALMNYIGDHRYNSTTAVNAVRFLPSAGTFASGSISCYGLAK